MPLFAWRRLVVTSRGSRDSISHSPSVNRLCEHGLHCRLVSFGGLCLAFLEISWSAQHTWDHRPLKFLLEGHVHCRETLG